MKCLVSNKLSQRKFIDNSGYLICADAILARTGSMDYIGSELNIREHANDMIKVEHRKEDLLDSATIASFENKPLTIEHPAEDVTPENRNELGYGYIRDVHVGKVDGYDCLLGTVVVTDQHAIDMIQNGEMTELSCGYDCDIMQDDKGYYQTKIRGNHVALCESGRAGIAKIRDSKTTNEFNEGDKIKWLFKNKPQIGYYEYDFDYKGKKYYAIRERKDLSGRRNVISEEAIIKDNYLGVLPKQRRYRYRGYILIDHGYSSAPIEIEGEAKEFKTIEAAKKYINEQISANDTTISDVIANPDKIDTENYVENSTGTMRFARAKGEEEYLTKAYCSNDEGKTWHTCYLQERNTSPNVKSSIQVGKMLFASSSTTGARNYIGRNVLTYCAANGIHKLESGKEIDHINGDYSDDRLSNLRMLSHEDNVKAYNLLKAKNKRSNNMKSTKDEKIEDCKGFYVKKNSDGKFEIENDTKAKDLTFSAPIKKKEGLTLFLPNEWADKYSENYEIRHYHNGKYDEFDSVYEGTWDKAKKLFYELAEHYHLTPREVRHGLIADSRPAKPKDSKQTFYFEDNDKIYKVKAKSKDSAIKALKAIKRK